MIPTDTIAPVEPATRDDAVPVRPHIVGLGGSLRPSSSSLRALEVALAACWNADASVDLVDVRELGLPLYGSTGEVTPPAAVHLADLAEAADAMIWSSPLYHGTVSASFKNALDWLQLLSRRDPPFLTGKPVGLIATAAGTQALQAVNTMEFVVRALRGWTVPLVVPVARAHQAFDEAGQPRDPALADQLSHLGHEVTAVARRMAEPLRTGTDRRRRESSPIASR
ncbi:MAG: NAD(P)H-dependent oxidoreductase [Actinomycetota bacterium]|nr:NAD(P)H-dependent oxidoreductase [Actinomycetota bacterium]